MVTPASGSKRVRKYRSKANIQLPSDKIAEFCHKHHIRKLSLFGSVLREDFGPSSDVDILVEFEPGIVIGYIGLAGLEIELSKIVGRNVDIRTPADLSRYFRKEVIEQAEVRYVTEGG